MNPPEAAVAPQWRVMLTDWQIGEDDIEAVMETLRSGWLTMGPRTQELEARFAEISGATHAIAVSSASAALHLLCRAAGVGPGDEVIVPAISFVADAHAPRHCGGTTVLADIDSPTRPLLGVAEVEPLISERTKAVIAVHMFGYSGAADAAYELAEFCAERGVTLLEDCAQASGARYPDGRWVGSLGLAGCFSFFSKTALGVGEGGIITTDDADFAAAVRSLRSHAMSSVTWDRHRGHAETYDVGELGYNYRLDEPRATLALSRLGRLDASLADLKRIARAYRELLADLDGVELTFSAAEIEHGGHFAFPVLVADGATRDRVREQMRLAGVQSTAYPALNLLTEYLDPDAAPRAADFAARHIALPIYADLSTSDQQIVVAALADALGGQSGG